jgi:TonB family protein
MKESESGKAENCAAGKAVLTYSDFGAKIIMKSFVPVFAAAVVLLFCLLFTLPASAQDKAASAPVAWERYKVSEPKISVLLPKLPTAVKKEDLCNESSLGSYFAYAENAVYEFSVTAKSKKSIPRYCSTKKPFGENTLLERVAALRGASNIESSVTVDGVQGYKFAGQNRSRWIFPHMDKNFWIELAIFQRPDAKVDEERFINSIDLTAVEGKEIGEGSPITLGDEGVDSTVPEDPKYMKDLKDSVPFWVISKPMARYTDAARQAKVQGNVQLRITFLASGGVGSVTVLRELPNGLTEQAVAAAKRVSFLPKRVNGVPVTVAVTFEYGFHIY